MQRRTSDRVKRRLTVGLRVGAQQNHGIVLDVSPSGLFVATTAAIQPGTELVVEFSARDGSPAFEVRARVVRRRRVPQNLQSYESPGIGLQVIEPPPAYEKMVQGAKLEGGAAEPGSEAPPARPLPCFRLRLRQSGSPRSRTLQVEAEDEAAARAKAAQGLEGGWEIVEIQGSTGSERLGG
jgi:hypothetical protein